MLVPCPLTAAPATGACRAAWSADQPGIMAAAAEPTPERNLPILYMQLLVLRGFSASNVSAVLSAKAANNRSKDNKETSRRSRCTLAPEGAVLQPHSQQLHHAAATTTSTCFDVTHVALQTFSSISNRHCPAQSISSLQQCCVPVQFVQTCQPSQAEEPLRRSN
ncbi:hypothetical protein COO60DRAFT_1553823 [Scenedesmus sp. NREL 46B-D3]|nr:hypothetical protein COO60DRAFT_1553823 [Scenedesmus sp. NREL 46B-D3]